MKFIHYSKGFTLVEILTVIALMSLFLFLTVPIGMDFYREQIMQEQAEMLANNLKNAQARAQAGKGDSSWGLKFEPDDQGCTNCYVFFKGDLYEDEGRNEDYDWVFELPTGVSIEEYLEVKIDQIIFERGTGEPRIIEE